MIPSRPTTACSSCTAIIPPSAPPLCGHGVGSASLTPLLSRGQATDASGTLVARQLYDAWGNIRASASSGTMPTPSASLRGQADIGYTGQRFDNPTGLMYYRARYYASSLGRFASADTIVPDGRNPQQLNRYAYALNSPLKYTDPSGHCAADDQECLDAVSQIQDLFTAISLKFSGKSEIVWVNWGHDHHASDH